MNGNFVDSIKKKRVLFVTTKNIDYIRNIQEIKIIREHAESAHLIFSDRKGYAGRIIEVCIKLLKYNRGDVDVIFLGFAPQLILPFWSWKFRKKTIIIDFFISVYDTLIHDRRVWKDTGVFARLCHRLDSMTLKRADHIITDTRADAGYFIKEFHCGTDKLETLYLEADNSVYYPRKQQKRSELTDKLVVLYFGSILPLQGIDIVLDAVRLLKDQKDIYFQIIGPIPDRYRKPIQDNVEYIDWMRQEALAEYIANADLCLAGHFNGEIEKAKRTIPGKAYIYEMMQRPMILGDSEANHELFMEDAEHRFVEMGNAEKLSQLIRER